MRILSGFNIALLLFFSANSAIAQQALYKPQVHEISLQLGSINYIPALTDYYTTAVPLTIEPVNGLAYTYHYSIMDGFRLRFTRKTGEYLNASGIVPLKADRNDWDIRLGYLRKYHTGAGQLYAGAEAIYRMGKVYEYPSNSSRPVNPVDEFTHLGGGVFAGYRYFFSTHLSANFELAGYYTRPVNTTGEPIGPGNVFRLPNGEGGIEASISLNFHFVKMKKRCTCPRFRN